MFVIRRKTGESVVFGFTNENGDYEEVVVKASIEKGQVALAIDAPEDVRVQRGEQVGRPREVAA